MNIQPDAVFNTILHDTHESTPNIMASVSFDPEAVHPPMEEIKQGIKGANYNSFFNTPTPNTKLLNTSDDRIKDIKIFLQPHHLYPEPTSTPISNLYYPNIQNNFTHNLKLEACAATAATSTVSVTNIIIPVTMYNLDPVNPL